MNHQNDAEMPGAWTCDKCGFVLQSSLLMVGDGTIKANASPLNEVCPNDGVLMRPLTWREVNHDLYERLILAERRLRWLDQHCSFVADYPYVIGPFFRGELCKLADAGIAADAANEPSITTPSPL